MSLLFETIKIDNGKVCNIDYHNERLNRSRRVLFGSSNNVNLEDVIVIPEQNQLHVARCRLVYNDEIRKIDYFPYKPRTINSLRLVECNDIDYSFKYDDRSKLDELFEQRGDADEILIVKKGFITDTSFTNIVFYDSEKWITPSKPLLQGTKRSQLLKENTITESEIRVEDLRHFSKAVLVNAMLGFNPKNYIEIPRIGF